MARRFEICKCYVCGNVVEVVHSGDGALWCCGRSMTVFSERNVDPEQEPYCPVVERTEEGVRVTVGRELHVMEEAHHIQWIEIIGDDISYRRFFKPGALPEATFQTDAKNVRGRAYCTQDGLCVEQRRTSGQSQDV
jgi:superoxide reductase